MSIDKVEVTNARGDLLSLSLEDISNGYIVKDIDGLGPVKSNIVSSSFATMEGQQKQSASRGVRNVTMQLGYAPDFSIDQTIRTLRSGLYQLFMTGSDVTLTFYMTDGLTVTADGTVESCEPPLFVQEPQMDISIICFDPDFIDVDLIQMHSTFVTTDATAKTIDVPGTVSTGLTSLSFTAPKTLSEFTIYHTTPAGQLRTMTVSAPLILNDVVNISTIRGKKSITMTRTGITTSLLWAVSPESTWVELEPGENLFYLFASATNPAAIFVDFRNRYGGL